MRTRTDPIRPGKRWGVGDGHLRIGAHRESHCGAGGHGVNQSAGGTVPRLVMHRYHEMILGPGEGHVQQACFLGPRTQPFGRSHVAEPGTGHLSEPHERLATLPMQSRCRIRRIRATKPGDDRDRELETLGAVDGHDPQRVFAFIGAQLDPIDIVDSAIHPRQILGQGPTGRVAPGTSLVDHVAHSAPCLAGHLFAFVQRRGDAAPAVIELGNQLGRRALVLASAKLIDSSQGLADDAGLVGEDPKVLGEARRIGVAAEAILHQLAVIDAEDRGA